ncbi:MAG TPA: outer membrane beta-barrel protein [Thermoanaerobaculia bacterium]
MKKPLFLLALVLMSAVPTFAQSSEFGVLFGGTRRVIGDDDVLGAPEIEDNFELSNSNVEIYYGMELEPGTMFKLQAGRLEAPVAFGSGEGANRVRIDREGELEHINGIIEYGFDEAYGSTGFFAGVGLYRQKADTFDTETDFGFVGGINADFPLSRRYGVIAEAAFHWTNFEYNPRYLTLSAGLRMKF